MARPLTGWKVFWNVTIPDSDIKKWYKQEGIVAFKKEEE